MSSASTPFLFPANPMVTGALNRILSLFHATLCLVRAARLWHKDGQESARLE